MKNSASNLPLSASQEISLMTSANRLNRLITSLGFPLPVRMLAYDCVHDLSPIGMVLLGHKVHAVNSDPVNTQRLEKYVDKFGPSLTSASYPLPELGARTKQAFDVVMMSGGVLAELRTDSQLNDTCQQLAAAVRPGGLLLISSADFDDILRAKERVFRTIITDNESARQLEIVVRDWHGNGYEYTETHYLIEDGDGPPTVTHQQQQHRAWRCAEITLGLTRAGFEDVQWQSDAQNQRMMIARKRSSNRSD